MEIRQLRYFVTMADAGSLMKASERLRVAQPALSVQLANLETDLGVRLFDRSNRGIELTDDGKRLYAKSIPLLRQHEDLIESMRHDCGPPRGSVSIGIPPTCSAILAPALYRAMRTDLPEVNLYIMDASSAVLYEWIFNGRLDFVILLNVPENAGLSADPLFTEELCLASAPRRGEGANEVEFSAIFDRPLVVPCPATTYRKILDDVATRLGKTFNPSVESDSFEVNRAIAISGQADAILPRHCLHADVAAGRLRARRLINPEVRGLLSLAHHAQQGLDLAQRAVRERVIRASRGLDTDLWPALSANVTPMARMLPSTVLPGHQKPVRPALPTGGGMKSM